MAAVAAARAVEAGKNEHFRRRAGRFFETVETSLRKRSRGEKEKVLLRPLARDTKYFTLLNIFLYALHPRPRYTTRGSHVLHYHPRPEQEHIYVKETT